MWLVGRKIRVPCSWQAARRPWEWADTKKKDGSVVKERHFYLTNEFRPAQVQDLLESSEVRLTHGYGNCHSALGFDMLAWCTTVCSLSHSVPLDTEFPRQSSKACSSSFYITSFLSSLRQGSNSTQKPQLSKSHASISSRVTSVYASSSLVAFLSENKYYVNQVLCFPLNVTSYFIPSHNSSSPILVDSSFLCFFFFFQELTKLINRFHIHMFVVYMDS